MKFPPAAPRQFASPATLFFACSLVLHALCAGCGEQQQGQLDAGSDLAMADAVQPPDVPPGRDAVWQGNIGAACDPVSAEGCTGQADCLDVGNQVGVCALAGCTLEDPSTSVVEDNCPLLPHSSGKGAIRTVCTRVLLAVEPADGGYQEVNFCLPQCSPLPDSNPCQDLDPAQITTRLSCDPLSLLLNGHSEVCLLPACTSDADCGSSAPQEPTFVCHLPTGTCHSVGDEQAHIGDPCEGSPQCGPNQFCYPEQELDDGSIFIEQGYCTIVGCKTGGPWACPEGSMCFAQGTAGALSLCLAVGCDAKGLPEADGCRDEASPGQYKCIEVDQQGVCWLDLPADD